MRGVTRRIVTGHAADGRSVIVSDAAVPHVREVPGARFDEIWQTDNAPEPLEPLPAGEPTSSGIRIGPSAGGSAIRVVDFAPGGQRSPMHRTRTIDYGIVLDGEIVMILSDSEVVLGAGDIVVQRATDHAWENRSSAAARIAFVLIDAAFAPGLEALIDGELTP